MPTRLEQTIDESSDPRVRAAMRAGAAMEGGFRDTGHGVGDNGKSFGPYQIYTAVHNVTPEQASDPVFSTRYMRPEYEAAVNKVPDSLWQSDPAQAAIQAAYLAERPATFYSQAQQQGARAVLGGSNMTMDNTPSSGLSTGQMSAQTSGDPQLAEIAANIEKLQTAAPEDVPALKALIDAQQNFWKLSHPYTPVELALKEYELQTQGQTAQDTRANNTYAADVGRWTAGQNATNQNFQNENTNWTNNQQGQRDIFGAQRTYGSDQQNLADAQFANQILNFDRTVGQDDRQLQNAQAAINRSLQGKDIGTQRASNIIKQTMDAAALAPPGGAKYVPGLEPGGMVATALGLIGAKVPYEAFAFPEATQNQGYVNINPTATLNAQDTALGVGGPIPGVPDFQQRTPPAAPDYNALGIQATDPSQLINYIMANPPPQAPALSAEGYPSGPNYSPMTPPPSLAGLLNGGFSNNGTKGLSAPPPPFVPQMPFQPTQPNPFGGGTLPAFNSIPNGAMFDNLPPESLAAMAASKPGATSLGQPQPAQGGGNFLQNLLSQFGQGSPTAQGMQNIQMPQIDPMALLNLLSPQGIASRATGLFGR